MIFEGLWSHLANSRGFNIEKKVFTRKLPAIVH